MTKPAWFQTRRPRHCAHHPGHRRSRRIQRETKKPEGPKELPTLPTHPAFKDCPVASHRKSGAQGSARREIHISQAKYHAMLWLPGGPRLRLQSPSSLTPTRSFTWSAAPAIAAASWTAMAGVLAPFRLETITRLERRRYGLILKNGRGWIIKGPHVAGRIRLGPVSARGQAVAEKPGLSANLDRNRMLKTERIAQ